MENNNLPTNSSKTILEELRDKNRELLEKQCSRPLAKIPNFPETRKEFVLYKPSDISFHKWLTHPDNKFAFQEWVFNLLDLIKNKTEYGWCMLTFGEMSKILGISERYLRTTLNKLQQIGIIQSRHLRARRWLRVLKNAFDD